MCLMVVLLDYKPHEELQEEGRASSCMARTQGPKKQYCQGVKHVTLLACSSLSGVILKG